ncbi:MAG: hypothetical protein ACTSYR_02650 [Candidatus Odinarchaeia archaeon]
MDINEITRRLVLQLSGKFYEVKSKLLNKELDNLTQPSKLILEKIYQDLSSLLLKESIKLISRYISRLLEEQKNMVSTFKKENLRLKEELENLKKKKEQQIREIITKEDKYKFLELIEKFNGRILRYYVKKLSKSYSTIRRWVKDLEEMKFIKTIRKNNGTRVIFVKAPWLEKI